MNDYPADAETQWDWPELPDPPEHWGVHGPAHLLLGTLAHSSRWRGWLADSEDQPHLTEGLHQVAARLGRLLTQGWRFDRMATVCHPGSGRITASFGIDPPWSAGVPKRRGGKERTHDRAALVAHHPGQRDDRRGAGQPGPSLRQAG